MSPSSSLFLEQLAYLQRGEEINQRVMDILWKGQKETGGTAAQISTLAWFNWSRKTKYLLEVQFITHFLKYLDQCMDEFSLTSIC